MPYRADWVYDDVGVIGRAAAGTAPSDDTRRPAPDFLTTPASTGSLTR